MYKTTDPKKPGKYLVAVEIPVVEAGRFVRNETQYAVLEFFAKTKKSPAGWNCPPGFIVVGHTDIPELSVDKAA